MATTASDNCPFPLVLLDCSRATSDTNRMRSLVGRQEPPLREAYAAVAGDVYFLTRTKNVSPPSNLSHFFKGKTLRIKCNRMADNDTLESVERCVHMNGNQLVLNASGCSGKSPPGPDDEDVYCLSLVHATFNPKWLEALHTSIQLALMPERLLVDSFLRELSSADVVALRASLRSTQSRRSSEVINLEKRSASGAENANRMSCRASLLALHFGWLSNVGNGVAGIASGANLVDAVARGLSSVAVVGSALALVSVIAKGVTLFAESAALKKDFEPLYRGLQETAEQLLGSIIQAVDRGLRDEEVLADMVRALTEALSICQDLERRIWKILLGSVLKGESANDFRVELNRRHGELRILVLGYRSDNALRDTIFGVISRLENAVASREEQFVSAFRGFPSSPEWVVKEALPGLEELKQSILVDSQVAVAGCRHQVLGTKGEGGVGKTTACVLLCNAPAMQERFPDGIHFLQFGLESNDEQVLNLLCNTLEYAGGEQLARRIRDKFDDGLTDCDPLYDAIDSVKEWFAGKSALFVCDNVSHRVNPDARRRQPLPRLLQGMVADAPRSCLLLTTRYTDIARNIHKIISFDRLDALEDAEAVVRAQVLIEAYAGEDATDRARNDARQGEARGELIAACGGWQLPLCVCGRIVRESDGDWMKVSARVKEDMSLLLRARPDEEDAGQALGAVISSSLSLLDAAPGRKARTGICISTIRVEFGERCFGHLYSVIGIMQDLRYIPGRLLRALFAAVRTLTRKTRRSADCEIGASTNFEDVCLAACQFLELYGLVDLERYGGDYAVRLHDSKFHFCVELFKRDVLWTSVHPCRVHYEFLRELALRGTSGSTSLCGTDWASICGALTGLGETRLGWEPNLVQHMVTAAGAYMRRDAVHSNVTMESLDVPAAFSVETGFEYMALADNAEGATRESQKSTSAREFDDGNRFSEDAFECLLGLVTDFRWVRARAHLDKRRGVHQDLLTVFSSIYEAYRDQYQRDADRETRGPDPFCDDDVDSSYHLKGELAAIKVLRWAIVAANEGCFGVPTQQGAAGDMGGNALSFELLAKCRGFESLPVWSNLGDVARGRAQARVRQFVKSAEANVKGPWWKPVLHGGSELAALSKTGTRFITTEARHSHGLGWQCGLVTTEGTDASELMLSDDIGGCPEKTGVAVPSELRILMACAMEGETVNERDVVAAIDEGGCVFLWNIRRAVSGANVQLLADVNAGGRDADVEALGQLRGMCIGRQGKVVAVYNEDEVFVWAGHQGGTGGERVFRGICRAGLSGGIISVQVAKDGRMIAVLHKLELCFGSVVTCFKDAGDCEYSEARTIKSSGGPQEPVIDFAVASDSSCVYTLTPGGRLSRVDVASGSESQLGVTLKYGNYLVLLEDGARWRIVGVGLRRGSLEWWTDGGGGVGTGAVCGWCGELADEEVWDLRVRWAGDGGGGGGSVSRVFETFTSHSDGVWRVRRWRVGADGRVSPVGGAPPRHAARVAAPSRANAPEVEQFAVSSACAEAIVVERNGGVWVWDVRAGARTGCLTDERASAVDVSADGSVAATARWRSDADGFSVAIWDVRSRRRLSVLPGNGKYVFSLLLCGGDGSGGDGSGGGGSSGGDSGSGGGGGSRLWVIAGGGNYTLRVGDCRTGRWLHEVKSGQGQLSSLGYVVPLLSARDQHERTASSATSAAPVAGAEPAVYAWVASRGPRQTILWQLSSDGSLAKNPTQPAESTHEERAFADVFSRDDLSIQDWRQVPCGYGGLVAAKDIHIARSVRSLGASYSSDVYCWRLALLGPPSVADCSCPSFVLSNTRGTFAFVNMPHKDDATHASGLAAVTVGTDRRLQIWHLKLGEY